MSTHELKLWRVLIEVAWLKVRLWTPPMLRRQLERLTQPRAGVQSGCLEVDQATGFSIAEQLASLPAGGVVFVPAYFVGGHTQMAAGRMTLLPLTQYFFTVASAEHKQRRLAREFECAVLSIGLRFDTTDPKQRAKLEMVQRELASELLRASR